MLGGVRQPSQLGTKIAADLAPRTELAATLGSAYSSAAEFPRLGLRR